MPLKDNLQSKIRTGNNFRKAREKKGMTQEDVADATGISVTYYAGIERGEENPSSKVIEAICKALGVKSSEILPY